MTIDSWLLLTIFGVLIFSSIKIYSRIDALRQYNYIAVLGVLHRGSDDAWYFRLNINTTIPVVLGQVIDVRPCGVRVDRIRTNRNLSTDIHYDIEFNDLQSAYSYMADLQCEGHWIFSPIIDQKLPEEVEFLVKKR